MASKKNVKESFILSKQKETVYDKDLIGIGKHDGMNFLPNAVREKATESLINLKLTEKEKIDSGLWEWITITTKYGSKYKSLRKIQ